MTNVFVIRKGGYYYRSNAQGYTASLHEAGRYSETEAHAHMNSCDPGEITIFPAPSISELVICSDDIQETAERIVLEHVASNALDMDGLAAAIAAALEAERGQRLAPSPAECGRGGTNAEPALRFGFDRGEMAIRNHNCAEDKRRPVPREVPTECDRQRERETPHWQKKKPHFPRANVVVSSPKGKRIKPEKDSLHNANLGCYLAPCKLSLPPADGAENLPPLKNALAALIKRIAEVSTAVGWQAGEPALEAAGQIVSVLAANPEHIERFMAEGSELFIDGTFNPENGSLTYRAMSGDILSPSVLREKKGQQR